MGIEYGTAREAFLGEISRVLEGGREITRRTDPTRELVGESFAIMDPLQRCIVVRHRNNNVAASIAEALWTIAGRDDLAFIEPYLPRAADYSDDGVTWRGAYGPRLRSHFGVDQLDEARRLLLHDSHTRRAAMSLFDPGSDYADVDTKDVPCNNWLHFLRVQDRLDLSVAVRSLDLMWGFSGVDLVPVERRARADGSLGGPRSWAPALVRRVLPRVRESPFACRADACRRLRAERVDSPNKVLRDVVES